MSTFFKDYFSNYSDMAFSSVCIDKPLENLMLVGQLMILKELSELEEKGDIDVIRH